MAAEEYSTLRVEERDAVCRVTLSRPEVHNAFNETVIAELTSAFRAIADSETIRVAILTGDGKSFCAGADLNWMRKMAGYGTEENLEGARALARMLSTLNDCPKAVVGRIHGATYGGACGLAASCDVVVASERAVFALSEVKLGIVPATIAPFVCRKIGESAARRYFITGERLSAEAARDIGLVHVVAPDADLDGAVDRIVGAILTSGPRAVGEAKVLVREVSRRHFPEVNEFTARLIARLRATPEAQEGMAAFLEKRKPSWVSGD